MLLNIVLAIVSFYVGWIVAGFVYEEDKRAKELDRLLEELKCRVETKLRLKALETGVPAKKMTWTPEHTDCGSDTCANCVFHREDKRTNKK